MTTIEVAVGGRLAGLSSGSNAKKVAAHVRRDVAEVAEKVGLVGDTAVAVTSLQARDGRPLRVLVNGTPAPFPPDVLTQLWMKRPDYWEGTTDLDRSIARDCLEELCGESECAPDDIASVVVSIVRDSPALLVDDGQAARFGATSRGDAGDTSALRRVLTSLLDLGVAPIPADAVLEAFASNKNRVEDSVEAAFALLQGRWIEVRVSPSYRSTLTDTDAKLVTESAAGQEAKELFAAAEERLVVEWGIVPPDIVWKTVDTMDDATIVVKVNDRLSPPFSGLAEGECVVHSDDAPAKLDVKRTILNPAQTSTEFKLSVVDSKRIDELGQSLAALTPAGFAALLVYREIISKAFRLVGTEQTLFLMQDLEARAPELVQLVLRHFTVAEITQLLRAHVRESIPPRLLPVILERLAHLLIDPKPPEERAECVRRGLSSYIFHRFLGAGGTFGRTPFELSPEIEEGHVAEKASDPLYAEHVRDAVWSMLRGTGIPPMRAAVVVRKARRDAVYRTLAPELPDVVVLSGSELKPDDSEFRPDKVAPPVASAAFTRDAS